MLAQLTLATQADGGFETHRKLTRRDVFLAEMHNVVLWSKLCAGSEPFYPTVRAEGGYRPVGLGWMLCISFLSFLPQSYALSDPALEDGLYDWAMMRRSVGTDLGGLAQLWGFRADAPQLKKAFDVVCHASVDAAPFGHVIVNGMMASKPLVARAAGGLLELHGDGVTGLLVAPGDIDALAGTLRRLLDDPAMAVRLGSAGCAMARQRFSQGGVRAGVYALLQDVAVKHGRSIQHEGAL